MHRPEALIAPAAMHRGCLAPLQPYSLPDGRCPKKSLQIAELVLNPFEVVTSHW